MKFLLTVLVLASTVAFATETKKSTTTTTTESHAADHAHTSDAAKADHAHDDAHHGEKKVEKHTETKKSH
jgi:Ni/Co efflux regulator RcnB